VYVYVSEGRVVLEEVTGTLSLANVTTLVADVSEHGPCVVQTLSLQAGCAMASLGTLAHTTTLCTALTHTRGYGGGATGATQRRFRLWSRPHLRRSARCKGPLPVSR
jgi:hypothetical protein